VIQDLTASESQRVDSAGIKLSVIDRLAAADGSDDLDVLNLVHGNRVRVFSQDYVVRQFAGGDRSFDAFFVGVIGAVQGIDADRFVE
jgi:hypothetical protein